MSSTVSKSGSAIERQIRRGKAVLHDLKTTLEDLEDRRELVEAKKRNAGKRGTPLRQAAKELGFDDFVEARAGNGRKPRVGQLKSARLQIMQVLSALHGPENVRQIKDEIAWIELENAQRRLRWVDLQYVSDCPDHFIRLRNDVVTKIPKTFWHFETPRIAKFELTVLFSEITEDFVRDFSKFVSFLADQKDEVFTWEIFGNATYPDYGWSVKAAALHSKLRL
jgi:hypothetical protein